MGDKSAIEWEPCIICNAEARNALAGPARKMIEDLLKTLPADHLKELMGWDCWNCYCSGHPGFIDTSGGR